MTFVNEPLLELRRTPARVELTGALTALDGELPLQVPVVVDGNERVGEELRSTDPGAPESVVALVAAATDDEIDDAVERARAAARDWAATDVDERAAVLARAAGILRAQRHRLAALEVRECAKPWAEADADVAEAIDFLEYYAHQARRLGDGRTVLSMPGERNELRYVPRGVAAVIAPWNFPIAIPTGMTAAALVTGNPVLLKPAEQAPACGYALYRALRAGGVPADVLAFLPGEGAVGARLVDHSQVDIVAFTGSSAVGLEILARCARVASGQLSLKQPVLEMGGKNCVIVDSDADLDDAVPAIAQSAFGFAGQKCSAAARVLVHADVHADLLERLGGAVAALKVGQASDFGVDVPAVIDPESRERVQGFIAAGGQEGEIVAQARVPDGDGWWVAPTLISDLPAASRVLRDEIFGPVLAVESVPSIDAAVDAVRRLPWALTGGVFSRNPRVIQRVVDNSPVGNLYVNRQITGAMVGRQPFGGNRLSGTGTKAGGPDYLYSFVEARSVSENTMRHGLVV